MRGEDSPSQPNFQCEIAQYTRNVQFAGKKSFTGLPSGAQEWLCVGDSLSVLYFSRSGLRQLVFSLKDWDNVAQGNALGRRSNNNLHPEGVRQRDLGIAHFSQRLLSQPFRLEE